MAIHPIDGLALYFKKSGFHPEKAGSSYYPMVSLINSRSEILAAIKFRYSNTAWHVDNVVALSGYGPTIYQLLMQLAGQNGLAPCYKHGLNSKEFIVDKSKKIWNKFHESPSVRVVKIEEKYSEAYLNYKFILKEDSFDLAKAYRLLNRIIIKSYLGQLDRWERLKLCVSQKIDDKKLDEFEKIYIKRLESAIVDFLEPSVKAHAKA
ncbi:MULTISPECIES: hypothetical protein [Pseudomonas]|uniref:hypothetical protein n=1 Tax=Pseudomonas TaxID=286 RepID=UPI001C6575A1|nr:MULTISPECIES: hypothetical protein [unclassified Pseudomonas]MBW8130571.1 hypothetical protein [Pseudomonas sp. LAP_36]MBW8139644.1 hypothetical protein [Pseudomonas sp. PAMC 26818]